jgi:hypothetical protein
MRMKSPGNGIDDDGNGYIDDIHGWNFLGNPSGQNIKHEQLEKTRIFKMLDPVRDKLIPGTPDFILYQKVKKDFLEELDKEKKTYEVLTKFEENYNWAHGTVSRFLGKEDYSDDELQPMMNLVGELKAAAGFLLEIRKKGFNKTDFQSYLDRTKNQVKYRLDTAFDARKPVGDHPEKMDGIPYGNPDVKGPSPGHGTGVAGIIAALRDNSGVDGLADNVKIMVLRVVPDGDERDKDIANAYLYAIRNGAQVINCSFGKSYSPQKNLIDSVLREAEKSNVLIIHAAGNDSENNDTIPHYPDNRYLDNSGIFNNWITVGASSVKPNKYFPGYFSNYGKKTVDLFAPGVSIYSLAPDGKTVLSNGTSDACPVVTGVAAVLFSYYPELDAAGVKEILMKTSCQYPKLKVYLPDKDLPYSSKVLFSELSVTGGVVNAYEAVQMAESKK